MKICIRCKEEKPLSQYHNDKSKKDGKVSACRSCKAAYISIYYRENSDKMKETASRHYYKNKDEINSRSRDRYRENIEELRKARKAKYWSDRGNNIRKSSEYHLKRLKDDSFYRFAARCRKRVWAAFNERGYSKNTKTFQMIGCSQEELIKYIEGQFEEGMSWDNYGDWHLDHKIPISSAENEEELSLLCHYLNLQPLWSSVNISKGARYCPIHKEKTLLKIRKENERSSGSTSV